MPVCGMSLPMTGLRMSASRNSVRSRRARGGRTSSPATYSTLGSRSSRRASSVPRRVDTPVIRTRRPLTSSSSAWPSSSRACRCAWPGCAAPPGCRRGRRVSPAPGLRSAGGTAQRPFRGRRPRPARASAWTARPTPCARPHRAASPGPAPVVSCVLPSAGRSLHRFARVPGASSAIHLKPAAELAERVLLPGDPHRALAVAQSLLDQPKMFNHHRGLWGYTGTARDGELLTVQATGMGGPSAAIVVEELIVLGAGTFIRIGTCGALTDSHAIGEIVAPEVALALDGTSRALGSDGRVRPDGELAAALHAPPVVAASVDVFYGDPETGDADVVEMECATLFQIAKLRGVRAAAVLGVSDALAGGRTRIEPEQLDALGIRLGEVAWAALTR